MATTELELQLQEIYGKEPPKQENGKLKQNEFDDEVMKKYRDMANTRGDYSMIDPGCFATPTMGEMLEEDLMYSIYKKIESEVTGDPTEQAILNRAFYSEAPISTELGYHPDHDVFILKFSEISQSVLDWQLNAIDGDTVNIDTVKINDGKAGFTKNGVSYNSFLDYCRQFGTGSSIGIRYAGVDTPEIPHLATQYVSDDAIIQLTYKDIRTNTDKYKEYRYLKYPITKNGKDVKKVWDADCEEMSNWKARTRKDDEVMYFIKTYNEDTKTTIYNEIVDNFTPSQLPNKDGLKPKAIVTGDDTTLNTVVGGYRAKRLNKDKLEKVQDRELYVMINAGGIEPRKTTKKENIAFNNWWYTGENIEKLVEQWNRDINDIGLSGIGYNAYGMDTYGRFLGTIYVKEKVRDEQGEIAETWINLAKYILSDDDTHTVGQKDYTGSPELQEAANGLSDAFNLWSYDKNNIKWLDSFENMTKSSYDKKIKFHKEVVGYDFTKSRDCAVMIGDTLLLIPPQSIRNVSHNSYEKVATMRGKGSMVKANSTREHMLELELFFYGEQGINGIPKEFVLPNGQKTIYYMNGLRSLVSQFKIAPFLPIENGYINDVLGIEAVTLMNLHIESVEGFPRLLKAVLSLREFNYRVFMPDVPVDDTGYDGKEESKVLSEMNPMFAKCFEWELFRYYYQRAIQQGESLKFIKDNQGFNSYDYGSYFYSKKNTLQPMGMCSSKIAFHVPDKTWLSEALIVKKERDQNRSNILPVELTQDAATYLKTLAPVYTYLSDLVNGNNVGFTSDVANIVNQHKPGDKKYVKITPPLSGSGTATIKNVLDGRSTALSTWDEADPRNNKFGKYIIDNYLKPLFDPVVKELKKNQCVYDVTVDEEYDKLDKNKTDAYMIKWKFNIKLDLSTMSNEDINSIKESLSLAMSKSFDTDAIKNEDILKNDSFVIDFSMAFNPETKELFSEQIEGYKALGLSDTTDYRLLKIVGQQFAGESNEDKTDTSFNEHNQSLIFNVQDYKNPANMPFVPYVTDVLVKRIGVSLGNYFTEISLKAVDGHAPQYMGGQDATIELELLTDDKLIVSAINTLPSLAIDFTKDYRRIMSCWPIKAENELLQLMGISEVLIDNIEITTVEGFPGLYNIFMRLASVDRTQRQREALRKLDAPNNSGYIGTMSNKSDLSIKTYFALDEALSRAELYPDLDIPTIEELARKGYRFVKYSGKDRVYPDPDFYVVYSFPYTAMIIKDMIDKFLEKELFNPDAEVDSSATELMDQNGIRITKKVAATLGVETVSGSENDTAKLYSSIIQSAQEEMKKPEYMAFDEKTKELIQDTNEINYILNYLTACDIQEGWKIKPGWTAPLCTHYTNQALEDMVSVDATDEEKNNSYAKEILQLRKDAIELINKILNKPINYNPTTGSYFSTTGPMVQITNTVKRMFVDDEDGFALLKLLCPFDIRVNDIHLKDDGAPKGAKYFETPNILRYISGFAYAAGCKASGLKEFSIGAKDEEWCPNQFKIGEDGKYEVALDKSGKKVKHNNGYVYMPLVEPKSINKDFETARDFGVEFGMFKIKHYSAAEVSRIMAPYNQTVEYTGGGDNMYTSNKSYPAGFIDPYYNKKGVSSEEGTKYKHAIMCSSSAGAEAMLRVMLVHLKRLILEGAFFSELDIIAKDYDEITAAMTDANTAIDEYNELQALLADAGEEQFINTLIPQEDMAALLKNMPESFNKSFCARMIYPFLSMVTENHKTFQQWIVGRDYDSLNILTGATTPSTSKIKPLDKFLKACAGIGMFERDNKKDNKVSDSQKIINNLMKDVYISAAEDPRLYVMHSFYDMLINDKRGRLVRAFPTYYMVFMDEGRKIGSWKLHDNFYNMSAINEIQVVKSRKIAADTCRIVMSNMYNSYAQDHDVETTQQYVDVYGLRDVFDSIFSPAKYFEKEEMLRNRMTTPDKVVLQPGIRIHVRMGYTADGGKLPIVFNGKIAEVGVEDVVEIIAQGDGHELMNPLNAFGALEATALQEAQQKITAFKDLRGKLVRGGESPRNLLALILAAKHGGLVKNAMNEWFDGRWFNDNPFGIMHFGDPKMKEVFEQGEVTQNLYEVSDATLLKGVEELVSSYDDKTASPTINTSIQDKTFWDLLHMAANSGIEYYGAIRDFGMRSTVFLGKANHYYAYAYKKVDDKIIERRKPFQQYHHYDSYTDIVYNSIKASEANIKTNAMGTWEASTPLWGREQATVGPIYLDMNIYPEYQKSMTVDTGLLAAGNGGIDIPLTDHFGEKWAMNANDDKVNKELAWRMTMNVLRQTVKDMYQGELCVIGDPSIKPYDRFFMTDSYEDMEGQMEVEAVVYSMNAETGFTTTITPDVIVRHNDPHEVARQRLFANFASMAKLTITSRLMLVNTFAAVDNKLIRAIAKSDVLYGLAGHASKTASNLSNAVGLSKYADNNPALGRLLNKLGASAGTTVSEAGLIKATGLIDDMAAFAIGALNLSNADDIVKLAKSLELVGSFDIDDYKNSISKIYSSNKNYLHMKDEVIEEALKNVDEAGEIIAKAFSNAHKADLTSNTGFVTLLNNHMKNNNIKQTTAVKDAIAAITKESSSSSNLKNLSILLKDDEVIKILKADKQLASKLTYFVDASEDLFKGATNATKFSTKLKKLLKSDDIIDSLKAVFKFGLRFNLGTIAVEVLKTAFMVVIANNANEFLTRWIKSVQALTVYPINRNGRALVAGMNGHKGSVFGVPPKDGYNTIQGWIMKTYEYFENIPLIGGMIVNELVNKDVYEQTVNQWKTNLGILEDDSLKPSSEEFNQELYNTLSNELTSRMKTVHSLKTRARLRKFVKNDAATRSYKTYKITGVKLSELSDNTELKKMIHIRDDMEILKALTTESSAGVKMSLAHDEGNGQVTIKFENGPQTVQFIAKDNIYDLPVLREECVYIINRILNQHELKKQVIHFMSGTRVNHIKTWKNTGYSFTIKCDNAKKLVKAIENVKEDTKWEISNEDTQYLFDYKETDGTVVITAYAPVK